jgi:hypothetical protein
MRTGLQSLCMEWAVFRALGLQLSKGTLQTSTLVDGRHLFRIARQEIHNGFIAPVVSTLLSPFSTSIVRRGANPLKSALAATANIVPKMDRNKPTIRKERNHA